jgi:two-component system sensor histidine kinase YesM
MKILNHVSVKIALIMVFIVLPLNVIAIVFTENAQQTIVDQESFNTQKLADYQMQQLENVMDNARALLTIFQRQDADLLIIKNENVNGYEYESSKLKFFYRLKNMAETTDGADGYFYYFPDRRDGVVYGNSDGKGQMVADLWDMLFRYDGEWNPAGWHLYENAGQKYLIFLIVEPQLVYGAVIRLEDVLTAAAQSTECPDIRMELSEKNTGRTIKRVTEEETGGSGWIYFEEDSVGETGTDPGRRDAIVIRSEAKNLILTMELSRAQILKNVTAPQRLLWITAVSYLFLIPLLYGVLRLLLIGPLNRINEAHRQIERGNAGYRITEMPKTEEFLELSVSFNRMMDNLERLRIEGYEKELSRQRMELRNLQLQIRPHFLLNTFNLIFTLSQRQEHGAIQRTVIWLSDYFRYIFREEKELELFSKERKLIEGYVELAKVRYGGRVTAEYELDPEMDFVRVPPLLIHNFVENAVKYGIKKDETLHIRLEGEYAEGTVTFYIRDDGKGMTEEILERNRAMFCGEWEPECQTKHLGLYNSLRRLTYFYGEEARITVSSRLGEGTCFQVRFPYKV